MVSRLDICYSANDRYCTNTQVAHKKGLTLKESAMELEALSEEKFDEIVRPELMIAPADRK